MFWRWFETRRYWIAYYGVYLAAIIVLAVLDWPKGDRQEWASLLTVSAGLALALAAAFEIGVRAMLLIPATLKKIRKDERKELLDTLERLNVITSDQRRDFEAQYPDGAAQASGDRS